jgi:hypothetical protein
MAKASENVTTIAKNKQNLSLTIENSCRQSVYICFWCYQGYHELLAVFFPERLNESLLSFNPLV